MEGGIMSMQREREDGESREKDWETRVLFLVTYYSLVAVVL